MKFHALLDFIQTRMRMAHIYQLVMIRTLLDHQCNPPGTSWRCPCNHLADDQMMQGTLDLPPLLGQIDEGNFI